MEILLAFLFLWFVYTQRHTRLVNFFLDLGKIILWIMFFYWLFTKFF